MRGWTKEQLHKANKEECRVGSRYKLLRKYQVELILIFWLKVLVERWQSQECMEAILEFFASRKKAKL